MAVPRRGPTDVPTEQQLRRWDRAAWLSPDETATVHRLCAAPFTLAARAELEALSPGRGRLFLPDDYFTNGGVVDSVPPPMRADYALHFIALGRREDAIRRWAEAHGMRAREAAWRFSPAGADDTDDRKEQI